MDASQLTFIHKYKSKVFTAEEFQTLSALAHRLLPLRSRELVVSVAALIDNALYRFSSDGWRFFDLPPDRHAIRSGLQLLNFDALKVHSAPFANLTPPQRDYLLARIQREGNAHWPQLPAEKWFEEIRTIVAELFTSSVASADQLADSVIAACMTLLATQNPQTLDSV